MSTYLSAKMEYPFIINWGAISPVSERSEILVSNKTHRDVEGVRRSSVRFLGVERGKWKFIEKREQKNHHVHFSRSFRFFIFVLSFSPCAGVLLTSSRIF